MTPPEMTPGAGLSPRGRGNPHKKSKEFTLLWSIPAWAGGTGDLPILHSVAWGLSPRGRGNRALTCRGSIPAWAGEPTTTENMAMRWRVYPRVGGGTVARNRLPEPKVYPRVGGGTDVVSGRIENP